MTYSQKLRDPRWQKKRLHILERDKWTCQCCRSTTSNLQVHHLFYAKLDPWDYPDEAYQTLCENCHKTRQGIVDGWINQLRVMLGGIPTHRLENTFMAMGMTIDCELAQTFTENEVTNQDPCDRPPSEVSVEKGRDLFAAMRAAASEGGER